LRLLLLCCAEFEGQLATAAMTAVSAAGGTRLTQTPEARQVCGYCGFRFYLIRNVPCGAAVDEGGVDGVGEGVVENAGSM
jgi:hypothetical protein